MKSLKDLCRNIFSNPKSTVQGKIISAIHKHDTIVCLRHKEPDPDAIGSQHGLAELIKNTFPSKHVYCAGENAASLNWLGTSDDVSDDTFKHALVLVTDCPDIKRISDNRWKTAPEVIKIDHHPLDDKFASFAWIDPKKSSASEMVAELGLEYMDMNPSAARFLYAGIIGDTGRFMFPGVTGDTFRLVGRLADFGIDMNAINRHETETTMQTEHLYGYLEQHIHMLPNGTAWYVVTKAMMKKFGVTPDDFISKNIPGNVKGVVAWAMFTEADDNLLKISLRSHAPAINKLAAKYNGGGHALASGARIPNNTDTKANVNKVVTDLSQVVDNYRQGFKN